MKTFLLISLLLGLFSVVTAMGKNIIINPYFTPLNQKVFNRQFYSRGDVPNWQNVAGNGQIMLSSWSAEGKGMQEIGENVLVLNTTRSEVVIQRLNMTTLGRYVLTFDLAIDNPSTYDVSIRFAADNYELGIYPVKNIMKKTNMRFTRDFKTIPRNLVFSLVAKNADEQLPLGVCVFLSKISLATP